MWRQFVAGELGEMLDILEPTRFGSRFPGVADVKLAHLQAEGVDVDDASWVRRAHIEWLTAVIITEVGARCAACSV